MTTRTEPMLTITAKVMNAGTECEFVRLFFYCPDGHDLGSSPLSMALAHDVDIHECHHYEHKRTA